MIKILFPARDTAVPSDLTAGLLVALIALPLCFGIATASGFPPIAGVTSAIIGGLVVSRLNGVPLGINGPAAGLITVVYAAVQNLGQGDALAGYRYTLAAVVVAGVLQMLLGMSRAARIAALFPAAIAHGMLAAIGVIIIVRQAPILLGTRVPADSVWQGLARLPESLFHFSPPIFLVGLVGLAALFAWPMLNNRGLGRLPAPIVAVVLGYLLGQAFDLSQADIYLRTEPGVGLLSHALYTTAPQFLGGIPDRLLDGVVLPDFGKIATADFWDAVAGLFLVGSLESLLVASAVDRLAPGSQRADLNRDIAAVGFGNMLSGLVGGLPMILEIVRSSANIGYGARSANANFFHGVFLLLFVALLPHWLNAIPLASMAALLIYAGYRLASPETFAKVWGIGTEQLFLFVFTLLAVLATNILAGVGLAMVAKLLLSRWLGGREMRSSELFSLSFRVHQEDGGAWRVWLDGPALFSNFLPMKTTLMQVPKGGSVVIDVTGASLIDHTVMDFLHRFSEAYTAAGGDCEIVGLEDLAARSGHPLAARFRLAPD